jgi:hypothetical protein
VSRLRWRNLRFGDDVNLNVVLFDHGCRNKNSKFGQGAKITVSAISQGACPVCLLRELQKLVESDPKSFVFRGFNGRLVTKSPGKTQPHVERINYDRFFVACRCGLVEYLGSPQRSSASNLVLNRAAMVELLPRPTRKLPQSHKVNMEIGTHGRRKNSMWKKTRYSFVRDKSYHGQ